MRFSGIKHSWAASVDNLIGLSATLGPYNDNCKCSMAWVAKVIFFQSYYRRLLRGVKLYLKKFCSKCHCGYKLLWDMHADV